MSYEAVAAAIHHSKASTSAKLVLVTIAHYEGEQGAWPSQTTLANMTGLSTRSVRRAISELAELNELDVIHDAGAGYGARKSNRYFVIVQCPEGCDSTIAHKQRTAEVVSLAAKKRNQYRTETTRIEDTHGRNTGQKQHQ
jgi:Helix-turn-helix domain